MTHMSFYDFMSACRELATSSDWTIERWNNGLVVCKSPILPKGWPHCSLIIAVYLQRGGQLDDLFLRGRFQESAPEGSVLPENTVAGLSLGLGLETIQRISGITGNNFSKDSERNLLLQALGVDNPQTWELDPDPEPCAA